MSSRQEILALDRAHVWRPYTSAEDHASRDPLVIERAEGAYLYDYDGRRYLDGNGSWWVNTLGHGHPRLRRALTAQSERLIHCSLATTTHAEAALLARDLVEVAPPGLSRVFFSDDGSTAVEVALKMAFQYWQQNGRPERRRFLALSGAFHGDTLGATSVGGVEVFRSVFGPLLFDVLRPPESADAQGWARTLEVMEELLRAEGDTIAGVIVEPILQGAAGMRFYSPELLARVREATRGADTFLIADEVFTGYGRLGVMWASDLADVQPDILCVAKAFSGGMLPMAATLATARVFDGFRGGRARALMHGHSFCGNPLGAAVAREVLAIYRDERIVEGVAAKAPHIARAFAALEALPGVRNARARGFVAAVELGDGGYDGGRGWQLFEAARARGAYLRPLGDTVYIAPPLTLTVEELEALLGIVRASVEEVLRT